MLGKIVNKIIKFKMFHGSLFFKKLSSTCFIVQFFLFNFIQILPYYRIFFAMLTTASVAGTIAAKQATMLFFSVTPPAWFASAVTAVAAAGAWMLINTDKEAGTYVDFYGWYGTFLD
ncbi:hypothetical protein ACJ7K1_31985 [Paenibacillus elgii]